MTEPLELANRLRFITTLRESSIAGPLLGYNEIEALIEAAALIECQSVRPAQDGFNAGIEAAAKLLDKAHDEWLGWADGAPPEGLEHYVTLAGYAEGYAASIRELKNPTGEILSGFECSQCRGIWRRGQPESHEDGCPLAIRALKREG